VSTSDPSCMEAREMYSFTDRGAADAASLIENRLSTQNRTNRECHVGPDREAVADVRLVAHESML